VPAGRTSSVNWRERTARYTRFCFRHSAQRFFWASAIRLRASADILVLRRRGRGIGDAEELRAAAPLRLPRNSGKKLRIFSPSAVISARRACAYQGETANIEGVLGFSGSWTSRCAPSALTAYLKESSKSTCGARLRDRLPVRLGFTAAHRVPECLQLQRYITELGRRINELTRLRDDLRRAVKKWKDGGVPSYCASTLSGTATDSYPALLSSSDRPVRVTASSSTINTRAGPHIASSGVKDL